MKRKLIVALVCLNVALLLAVAVGTGTQYARAQTFRSTDYLLFSVNTGGLTSDGICVVDLATRKMVAWQLSREGSRYRLRTFRSVRDLSRDFRRKEH